ncbi:MAG: hemolysin XhlA family protein [Lysinibacillus sp.]
MSKRRCHMTNKSLTESSILTDILERTVRTETKIDQLIKIETTADNAEKIATEALESTKSAHKRLDKFDKMVWWLVTTVGAIIIVALVGLIIKTGAS